MADPAAPKPKTLYLIDGHAQFFRAYYAIRAGMTSPVTNEATNLTFGFVNILLKLMRDYRPDYLAVAIDVSGDQESFRSALYPEYKANRSETPDDFHPQVERCLQILEELEVPVIGVAGVEADDVIATLVKQLREQHADVTIRIVSRDKDLTQLSGDGVEMLDIYKDEVVTPADVFKVPGVEPAQVADILALMGDTSDNVPGVPGIGPKTAAKLIMDYGSIESLLERLDEIKGKRRENLEASREQIALSRRLVELKDDVDVPFALEDAVFRPGEMPIDAALATFRTLDFRGFQTSLRSLAGREGDVAAPEAKVASGTPAAPRRGRDPVDEGGLFDLAGDDEPAEGEAIATSTAELVTTAEALEAVLASVRAAGRVALGTQVEGSNTVTAALCGVSLTVGAEGGAYIPVRSPDPSGHLTLDEVVARLGPVLADPEITTIGHDLKSDLTVLERHGLTVAGPLFDTMIASYVVDATRSSHRLDVVALAHLEHVCTPRGEVVGTGKKQIPFEAVPLDRATPYAAEAAELAWRLCEVLDAALARLGLTDLFAEVEMPLVRILAGMEQRGITVDPRELDRQRDRLTTRADELRQRIIDAAPHAFNPDSPKQLAVALFNAPDADPPGLGIKVLKRGKTGPSTDVEVLEKLAADPDVDSPVPELIVEYRQLTKLISTYLMALKEAINPATGRVHASFHQTVAATGRLSSSDPNLQNIPIRTEVGREIRRAFVAAPGQVLITADYSQIELRVLAHLSEDPGLIEAFRQGQDIHAMVAAEVFGAEPEDVTPAQRSTAKMVNFGIVYGITAWGLARRLGAGTDVAEAQAIIDRYKERFGGINAFLQRCVAMAETNGYVETMLRRRRAVPQIHARHPMQRSLGERLAINTVVQGSAADLIKLAMIDLDRRLPMASPRTALLLQIHDELVFECPEADADAARDVIVERMARAMDLRVPLEVDAACSPVWIDAK